MARKIEDHHLGPIPDGHQIDADRMEVMGLVRQKASARRFVRGCGGHRIDSTGARYLGTSDHT